MSQCGLLARRSLKFTIGAKSSRYCYAFSTQPRLRINKLQFKPSHPVENRLNAIVPVFRKALDFTERIAVKDNLGTYTYANLILGAKEVSREIKSKVYNVNERIAFLCPNNVNSVAVLWGIWMSGHLAVPLSASHSRKVLEHCCTDCNAKLIVTVPEYAELLHGIAKSTDIELVVLDKNFQQRYMKSATDMHADLEDGLSSDFYAKQNALVLYTNDENWKPRGVVLSHKNLLSQVTSLVNTWRWSCNDTILHTLPMNHLYGIVNALMTPLYVGGQCTILSKFEPAEIWSNLLAVNYNGETDHKITVFMGVPIMYSKLIQEYEKLFGKNPRMVDYIKNILKHRVRLMLSASAPLSSSTFERWFNITGHKIINVYGQSETGMCLSGGYDSQRSAGYVGAPMQGVSARVCKRHEFGTLSTILEWLPSKSPEIINAKKTLDKSQRLSGELLIKSDAVFVEYQNQPDKTKEKFTKDGWYKTGDTVEFDANKNAFKVLGTEDVDIIKAGGHKVNVAEVENQLMTYPDIADCAVIGLPDATSSGSRIGAVLVVKSGAKDFKLESFRHWAKGRVPKYALPSVVKVVNSLPKSIVGKVNKTDLMQSLFADDVGANKLRRE